VSFATFCEILNSAGETMHGWLKVAAFRTLPSAANLSSSATGIEHPISNTEFSISKANQESRRETFYIRLEKTLLIFDEIQRCPEALTSLKYFYEKYPKAFICASGLLLGFGLSK
jgi:hypothetical protein